MAPSVSKSLLTQELLGCAWVVSVKQLEQHIKQLAQLVRGQISDFRWQRLVGQFLKKMRIGGNVSMNACARKGNGWRGDEITLKNQRGKKGD